MSDSNHLMKIEVRVSRCAGQAGFAVQVGVGGKVGEARQFDTLDDAAREIAQVCIHTSRRAGRVFDFRFAIGVEDDPKRTLAADLGRTITRYLGYKFEPLQ